MREILFRGKRIDNGEWVEGYITEHTLIPRDMETYIGWVIEGKPKKLYDYDKYEVIPETIGQYTGLKDKNGKRIFEGDIIKYADMLDYNCYLESLECPEDYEGCDYSDIFTVDEVVYCDNVDYPAFDLNKHDFESNGLSELIASYQYHYEVIGTIHDNKLEDFENGR